MGRMKTLLRTLGLLAVLALVPLHADDSDAADINNDKSLRQLRLAKFVMPEFPTFAWLTGANRGIVTVAIGRDAEGVVTDVLVLDSTNGKLTQSVITAVKEWKFARPANQPLPGTEIVPIVRFKFSTKGIAVVSALTGTLQAKAQAPFEEKPVVLPSFADLDKTPTPVHQPMPRLTGSRAANVAEGGSATVKFFVDETGQARVPVILEATTPDLGQAAITAVEQWRFDPPTRAGQPTIALEVETLNFKPKPLE